MSGRTINGKAGDIVVRIGDEEVRGFERITFGDASSVDIPGTGVRLTFGHGIYVAGRSSRRSFPKA